MGVLLSWSAQRKGRCSPEHLAQPVLGGLLRPREDVVVVLIQTKETTTMKKNSKKAAKKSTKRSAINYQSLAIMWAAGRSYEEMGKELKMKGNEANDPWKPVRAAISNMLRGKAGAWKDTRGQVKTLQPREGMRNIGMGKKAPKKAKKVVPITKGKATKKAAKKVVA
jgi:hypothetical protein